MPSKPYLKFSLPLAIALATLMLVLTTLSALADGPIINMGTSTPAISTFFGATASSKTGHSLAIGDINNDGREDLLIGAPYANLVPPGPSCPTAVTCTGGAVYLYLGRPGISQTFDLASYKPNVTFYVPPGATNGEELGRTLATGDVNNDGFDDIIMGASRYGSASWQGAVMVWVGRSSITTTSAISVELYGTNGQPGPSGGYNLKIVAAGEDNFGGWDVASGDINNDGRDDIIIGAPGVNTSPITNSSFFPPDFKQYHHSASPARTNNGAAYVWLGRTSLNSTSQTVQDLVVCLPELTIYGRGNDHWLGSTVATGDLDGDGFDDVIVGVPGFSTTSGLVHVFYGTNLNTATCSPTFQNWVVKDLMTTTANITLTGFIGNRVGTSFDLRVGNLNNDAFEDLVISAPFANDGIEGKGRVYVVYGRSRAGFSAITNNFGHIELLEDADVTVYGGPDTWMGASVLAADVNNDNTDDLLIGSPDIDPDLDGDVPSSTNSPTSGKVHVLYGGSLNDSYDLSSSDDAADLTLIGAFQDDWLGRGLAVADLNLDGFNELIAGAAAFDYLGRNDAGAAHVVNLVYPQLSITPSLIQVVAGGAVSFTSTAYTWLNGSTNVTPGTSFAIAPAAGGSWNGNIYQTANLGTWTVTGTYNTRTATTTITVLQPATATFTCTPSSCIRNENQSLAFNGGSSGGAPPLSYAWNFGDGASDNGTVTDHIYPDNGIYIVTLTVEGANGAIDTVTRPVTITNLPPVIQSVTNTGPITPGRSVTVTVAASDVPSDTLAYEFDCDNNGHFEIGPQPSNKAPCPFVSSGIFTVTARVTDGDGGSTLGTTLVTVFPVAAFSCNPSSCIRNENQALAFNGSGSVGASLSYAWNFGDGGSGSGANINHTYGDNGVYLVTLTVQDTKGLTAAVTRPVTITNVAPVIQQVTNSGPANPDKPVTITVTASDVPSDTLTYAFDCDNNGSFETNPPGNQAACQFSSEGVYTVTVSVTDGDGGSDSGTTLVIISTDPVAVFTCGTCSVNEAQPLAFEAANSPGKEPLSYTWSFGDGAAGSGLTLTHTYADNGLYPVILTVEAADGLTSTVSRPVTVTNLAPDIQSITNSGPITAGDTVTITVTATDIAADTLAYAFDCDNNGIFEIGPQASNKTACHFSDPGAFTVTIKVTDEDGGSAQTTTSVSVSAAEEPSSSVFLPSILK